ncbi:MAG: hypothetical protein QM610_09595 [Chitinophagaceae bacterium]
MKRTLTYLLTPIVAAIIVQGCGKSGSKADEDCGCESDSVAFSVTNLHGGQLSYYPTGKRKWSVNLYNTIEPRIDFDFQGNWAVYGIICDTSIIPPSLKEMVFANGNPIKVVYSGKYKPINSTTCVDDGDGNHTTDVTASYFLSLDSIRLQ